MYIVKLGGSVITQKDRLKVFKGGVAERLFREVAESGEKTMLVHGAGSFGHILASMYELSKGLSDRKQIEGISRVQADVRELNLRLLKLAESAGMNAVSIPPSATVLCQNKKIVNFNGALFEVASALGLTPVTFGDVVFDSKIAFCICSGDDMMLELAKVFRPRRAIFVSDVEGIYDKNPKVHGDAKMLERLDERGLASIKRHIASCSKCRIAQRLAGDVTGGGLGKVEAMMRISRHGVDSVVIGPVPGRLRDILSGRDVPGTYVRGMRRGKRTGD